MMLSPSWRRPESSSRTSKLKVRRLERSTALSSGETAVNSGPSPSTTISITPEPPVVVMVSRSPCSAKIVAISCRGSGGSANRTETWCHRVVARAGVRCGFDPGSRDLFRLSSVVVRRSTSLSHQVGPPCSVSRDHLRRFRCPDGHRCHHSRLRARLAVGDPRGTWPWRRRQRP